MAGADFSAADKRTRMSRQEHRCARCTKKLWHPILKWGLNVKGSVKPHFDHKKPRSRGGSSTLANCQALCPICHDEKSAEEAGSRTRSRTQRGAQRHRRANEVQSISKSNKEMKKWTKINYN